MPLDDIALASKTDVTDQPWFKKVFGKTEPAKEPADMRRVITRKDLRDAVCRANAARANGIFGAGSLLEQCLTAGEQRAMIDGASVDHLVKYENPDQLRTLTGLHSRAREALRNYQATYSHHASAAKHRDDFVNARDAFDKAL